MKAIFKKGISDKFPEFRTGMSEYMLTKFYLKKKNEYKGEKGKMPAEMQAKIKATFDVINEKQENQFIDENAE